MAPARDTLGRPIRDLRISVTDRCNFRCPYCMPREAFGPDHPFIDDSRLMKAEELVRIVRPFIGLGVEKIRLT
ncbi:MAG TPA: radical SAM protein, partial [Opitutaceae bacterium]